MAVVDLDGLALVGGDPDRRGVQHGQVEQDDGPGRTVQVDRAALFELFLRVEHRTVAGFRRNGKAVRALVHVGQVEHHLQVAAPEGPVRRMGPVPVPDLLRIAVPRGHVAQADLPETAGTFEDGLDRFDQAWMADQSVDLRRGDQGFAVQGLVPVVGNGMPETAPVRPVPVVQFDKTAQFLAIENPAEVDVPVLLEKVEIQHAGITVR